MKWKNQVPNMSEFLRVNTASFLQNEQESRDHGDHVKTKRSVETTSKTGDVPVTKAIPKTEFMKNHTSTFIENEKWKYDTAHRGRLEKSGPIDVDKERQKVIGSSWPIKDVRSDAMAITDTRVDYIGSTPKKYTTTCYLIPKTVPVWYTESVQIKINSTKRVYSETVYYKNKLHPHYWSEHMQLDVPVQKLPSKTVGTSPMSPRSIAIEAN